MARTLAEEDPAQVAFEPMNEPVIDCDADGTGLWPERQQRLFAAARASATRLTLVLTGACYSSAEALARIDPKAIPDDNIIWTFHSYEPFLLTHQGATWAGDFIPYVTGLPYPLSAVPRSRTRRCARNDPRKDQGRGAMGAPERHACLSRRADRQPGHGREAARDRWSAVHQGRGLGKGQRHKT